MQIRPSRILNICRSLSLTEFGFLWSVLFAPWGPVLRYLGWAIAFIGLVRERRQGDSLRGALDRMAARVLTAVLLWGALFTALFQRDPYLFAKGYSLIVEFAFSLWLAAHVVRTSDSGAKERFFTVLMAAAAVAAVETAYRFVAFASLSGSFTNIVNLGLFGVVVLPMALARTAAFPGPRWWPLSLAVLCIIVMSGTLGAWLTSVVIVLLLFVLTDRPGRRRLALLLLLFVLLLGGAAPLLSLGPKTLKTTVLKRVRAEVTQLLSVQNAAAFTSHRSYIWKGAAQAVAKRPVTGWGWGGFDRAFPETVAPWWNVKQMRIPAHQVSDAHNMYLNLAVDGGVPTALAVTGLFLAAAWRALRLARRSPRERHFWIGVAASALSLLFFGLAGDIFTVRYKFACIPWYLMGFALAREEEKEVAGNRRSDPQGQEPS